MGQNVTLIGSAVCVAIVAGGVVAAGVLAFVVGVIAAHTVDPFGGTLPKGTTFASFGLRLPAAWLLGVVLEMGLTGVWLGMCLEIVLRSALFAWRFLHGGWKRVRV